MTDQQGFNRIEDIFDRLQGDARKNHLPEDVMEVTTKDGLIAARQVVREAIASGLITQAGLCKRTGIKSTAINEFVNDKCSKWAAGTLATTAGMLARFINDLLREKEGKETEVGGFVNTRFAEEVFAIAQWIKKRNQIGAFIATAGMGKTMVLDAIVAETVGAIKVTCRNKASHGRPFLYLWCQALGLPYYQTSTAHIQDHLIKKLNESKRLVCIDEAHKLKVETLDLIREIWDAVRIPIILAATPSLYQMMTTRRTGSVNSEIMDQIYSRVAIFRNLTSLENPETGASEPIVSVEDVRKMFVRSRVRIARDGLNFLCSLANYPGAGGYRTAHELVQMIVDIYPGEEITAELLKEAMRTRVGIREAGFVVKEMELHDKKVLAAAG